MAALLALFLALLALQWSLVRSSSTFSIAGLNTTNLIHSVRSPGVNQHSSYSTCSAQSCRLVSLTTSLVPSTTIRPGSYIASHKHGGFPSTTVDNVVNSVFVTRTSVPSTVTHGTVFSSVNVSRSAPTAITAFLSVEVPPIAVTLPSSSKDGKTNQTVRLPPRSRTSGGRSRMHMDPATSSSSSSAGPTISTTNLTHISSPLTISSAPGTTVASPVSAEPNTIGCPPTAECSLVTALTSGSRSSTVPLPVFTSWPPYGRILPEEGERDRPEPDEDGVHVPCDSWFFSLCISWGTTRVRSWHWILPPGIYGPGPPPIDIIHPPPGVTIRGSLPPWPRITIGPDHQLTTESDPRCKTQTAEACSTTDYVLNGVTASSTTICETITGCSLSTSAFSTVVIGSQTAAPIGSWVNEHWPTTTLGDAYTNSVYAAVESRLAREEASAGGATLSSTSVAVTGPASRDAKDPESGVHSATTTTAVSRSTAKLKSTTIQSKTTTVQSRTTTVNLKTRTMNSKTTAVESKITTVHTKTTTVESKTTAVESKTKSPPSKPNTPLTRGPIKCFNEADFRDHADIQPEDQDKFSTDFGKLAAQIGANDLIGPDDPAITLHHADSHGVYYNYSSSWVHGCVTEVDKQSYTFPLGQPSEITAQLLVREDYTNCSNGGVGGSCQVGCLLYTFTYAGRDLCQNVLCHGRPPPFN